MQVGSVFILIYKQYFNFVNDNVPTLLTFALAFSRSQLSGSYSHKRKNGKKNKNVLDLTKVFELSGFASVCRHNVSSTGVATLLGYSFVCGTK